MGRWEEARERRIEMSEIMMLFQCKGVARKVPGKTHRERTKAET